MSTASPPQQAALPAATATSLDSTTTAETGVDVKKETKAGVQGAFEVRDEINTFFVCCVFREMPLPALSSCC